MKWNVQIGINPISWCNDDLPELGGETSLETILSEGAEIGYKGFELGNKFPKEGKELKDKLAQYDAVCVSGWYSGNLAHHSLEAEIAESGAHLKKLQYNGCKVVVYGEVAGSVQGEIKTALNKRPQFANEAAWMDYAKKLDAFGEHLKKQYGITLAYHHHMGAYVQSPEDIDKLMQLTDANKVSLLFDTGHAYFGGARQPITVLQKYVNRVVHVHCKDVRAEVIDKAENENWSFLTSVLAGVFTVPGDGVIDFAEILKLLHKNNYQGWLVVEAEQDPAIAPSYQYAQKGFQTLNNIVKEVENV